MPTKVTVIGKKPPTKRTIDLCHVLTLHDPENDVYSTRNANMQAHIFDNVELISCNYLNGFDLIFAYDGDRNDNNTACLFLGHWNDGIV